YIQIIGWLIQNKKIRVCHQYPHELQSFLFSATQFLDQSKLLLWRKQEKCQQLRSRNGIAVCHLYVFSNILDDVQHTIVFRELQTALFVIAKFSRFADNDTSRVGTDFSGQ